MLVQRALASQLWLFIEHSLTSKIGMLEQQKKKGLDQILLKMTKTADTCDVSRPQLIEISLLY